MQQTDFERISVSQNLGFFSATSPFLLLKGPERAVLNQMALFWMTAIDIVAGLVDEPLDQHFTFIGWHPAEVEDDIDALVEGLRRFDDPIIRALALQQVLYRIRTSALDLADA